MNTKALRQKILDLAIHGKLVPQDPNDEPASVLLERIRAEKERLFKEGKIKKPKKSKAACDKPHYPYELPKGWEWTTVGEISWDLVYGTSKKSSSNGEIPVLRMGNINRCGKIDWNNLVYTSDKDDITKYSLQTNDLLFNRTNSSEWVGKTAIYKGEKTAIYAGYIVRLRVIILDADYVNFVMNSSYYRGWCNDVKTDAVNQSNINAQKLSHFFIPIPPLNEQKRIVNELSSWLNIIEAINKEKSDLQSTICLAKSKILDLAIHGKLVPQDSNDKPASELLKRINPKAEITCDNPHYQNLPKGWDICSLENIIEYEQPTAYIVSSTDYDVSYLTPVLTAGKSFIIGHTNEKNGIYTNLPCIIFDDFTTDSKLVDFPFKVKSSAMKILQVKEEISIEYVAMFMSITRLISDTHKRYWISEYSKINIPIPPKDEQCRIVETVHVMFAKLDKISENL